MSDATPVEVGEDATTEYLNSGLHPLRPLDPGDRDARRRLLVAARDCFAEAGYRGTSTRTIASRAGMSPAAMYIHYPSKQAVLLKLCLLGHAAAYEAMQQGAARGSDPRSRLKGAIFAFAHWHAESHTLGRIVQWEIGSLEPENFALAASQRRAIDKFLRDILEEGARSGDFSVLDLGATTIAILSQSIDLVRWFPSRTHSNPTAIAASYAALAERMVIACPGT